MMELNNEIGILGMSKDEEFLSHSSLKLPEENIFKHFHHRYLDFRPTEWMLKNLFKKKK